MIKQMDKLVSSLTATRRRSRRIVKYWCQVIDKMVMAVTLPIWLIPYRIYRRQEALWIEKKNMQ